MQQLLRRGRLMENENTLTEEIEKTFAAINKAKYEP